MTGNSNEIELKRIQHGFWIGIIGLLIAAVIAVFLVWHREPAIKTSAEVVGIVGLFTTITGTLVGLFCGYHVGSAGIQHEREHRVKAEAYLKNILDDTLKHHSEIVKSLRDTYNNKT